MSEIQNVSAFIEQVVFLQRVIEAQNKTIVNLSSAIRSMTYDGDK